MTFTSIPPSLKPVVEDVASGMWQAEAIRASGKPRREDWTEVNGPERTRWVSLAKAAILAFLNACVDEKQIGRVSDVKARNSERVAATRLILNLGATDDKA